MAVKSWLDRLATWWLARRMEGEWVAFRNVHRRPGVKDGVVFPYLTQTGEDGVRRVLAVRKGSTLVKTLEHMGEPVPAPDVELAKVDR